MADRPKDICGHNPLILRCPSTLRTGPLGFHFRGACRLGTGRGRRKRVAPAAAVGSVAGGRRLCYFEAGTIGTALLAMPTVNARRRNDRWKIGLMNGQGPGGGRATAHYSPSPGAALRKQRRAAIQTVPPSAGGRARRANCNGSAYAQQAELIDNDVRERQLNYGRKCPTLPLSAAPRLCRPRRLHGVRSRLGQWRG